MDNESENKPEAPKTYYVSSKSTKPPQAANFTRPKFSSIPKANFHSMPPGLPALVIIVVLVASLSSFGGAWLESRNQANGLISTTVGSQKKVVTSQSQLISQIAKTVGPSVVSVNVNITSTTAPTSIFDSPQSGQSQQAQAAGTGIIVAASGLVITNRHVVPSGTTSVSVTLSDGTELKNVSVIGRTTSTDSLDIAFLKINDLQGHKLTPAVVGDSSTVLVGDDVVAIGNALGQFQNTVTSGIISGYGRSVQASDSSGTQASENLDNLFQTDAAINEGNSGGPLVNLNGQVIGMNTAIAGNAQNIGFAIPINDVKGLIEQVIKTGKFSRPYLGVRYIPLTADVASQYGLNTQNGAFVAPSNDPASPSVASGSPADQAGLKVNDIITQVDGTNVDQTHSLTSLLSPHVPGDKVDLTVVRGDKSLHVKVVLAAIPTS